MVLLAGTSFIAKQVTCPGLAGGHIGTATAYAWYYWRPERLLQPGRRKLVSPRTPRRRVPPSTARPIAVSWASPIACALDFGTTGPASLPSCDLPLPSFHIVDWRWWMESTIPAKPRSSPEDFLSSVAHRHMRQCGHEESDSSRRTAGDTRCKRCHRRIRKELGAGMEAWVHPDFRGHSRARCRLPPWPRPKVR